MFHGKGGRIQIDTDVITNASEWTLTMAVQTVEGSQFEETHIRNMAGMKADSGTLTAWQPIDAKVLNDASGTEGRLWIYPQFTTPTAYWYGVVLFTDFAPSGSTTSGVSCTLNFVNGNTNATGMVAHGFA